MTDYADLKRLAEAATPGPWKIDRSYPNRLPGGISQDGTEGRAAITRFNAFAKPTQPFAERNAAFIAAANPATILQLLSGLEASKAREEEARGLLQESADLTALCTTPERFGEAGSGEVFLRMTAHNAQAIAFLSRGG